MKSYLTRNRWGALLLSAVLLLALAPAARGETLYTHGITTLPSSPGVTAFTAAHPQVRFVSDEVWYGSTEELIAGLAQQPKRDLFNADSLFQSLDVILDPAYCADLSGSAAVRAAVGGMHPAIQAQVIREGKIYGVPTSILFSHLSWRQDAWDAAGLTAADVPTTYEELLDFLEKWVERIKKDPLPEIHVENRFDETVYGKHTYVSWLMDILMKTYILQAKYAGEMPDFNAPEFRALAERTVTVGQALYQNEPLKRGQGRNPQMRLFTNNVVTYSSLEMNDGFSHMIPLRITADQPALYEAALDVYCVGADSLSPDLALEFIEAAACDLDERAQALLLVDGKPVDGGWLSAQWLADYREHAGQLYFPQPGAMDSKWRVAADAYSKGQIDTDAFIRSLAELAEQAGQP